MAYQTGKAKEGLSKSKKSPSAVIKERDILKKYIMPISSSQDYDLSCDDDAAVVEFPPGRQIVVTSDTIIENVHFLTTDPPQSVAKKAIRVNLSDLAAMGAHPFGYTMCLTLSSHINEEWISDFVKGLIEDHKDFNISLIGGDITKGENGIHISVTAIGDIAEGQSLTRSNAQPGDRIYVTGTIGDAALGLKILQGEFSELKEEAKNYLISRYQVPISRHVLGQNLVQVAHACADISDGLVADLKNICEASELKAYIRLDLIPFSRHAKSLLAQTDQGKKEGIYETILSGGDDYELIFAASAGEGDHIDYLSKRYKVPITCIGHFGSISEDEGNHKDVIFIDQNGDEMQIKTEGYQHEWVIE